MIFIVFLELLILLVFGGLYGGRFLMILLIKVELLVILKVCFKLVYVY